MSDDTESSGPAPTPVRPKEKLRRATRRRSVMILPVLDPQQLAELVKAGEEIPSGVIQGPKARDGGE